jgi:hypothetical protein
VLRVACVGCVVGTKFCHVLRTASHAKYTRGRKEQRIKLTHQRGEFLLLLEDLVQALIISSPKLKYMIPTMTLNRKHLFLSTLIAFFASTAAFSPSVPTPSSRRIISDSPLKYSSNAQDSGLPRATAALQYSQSKEWIRAFDALVRFHRQHGHFQVPESQRKLRKWIEHQRLAYQAKQEGQASPLTNRAIERLNSIGFTWEASKDTPTIDTKVQEERQVPKNTKAPTKVDIGAPVKKLSVHNTSHNDKKRRPKSSSKTTPWMRNFYKLKKFQRKHGHLLVNPQTSLGQWLQHQKFVAKAQQLTTSSNEKSRSLPKSMRLSNQQYRLLQQLGVVKNPQLLQLEQDLYAAFVDSDKTTEEQLEAWKERYGLSS